MKDNIKWVDGSNLTDIEYWVEVYDNGSWNVVSIRSDFAFASAVAYSVLAQGIYTRNEIRITRVKKNISLDYYSIWG